MGILAVELDVTAVHIVKPGEHIGVIAARYGFENFSEIWNHPDNAELREKREQPFILQAGDLLHIPDPVRLRFSRATAASHDFSVNIDRIQLQLRVLDLEAKPRANVEVTIEAEQPETGKASSSKSQQRTTDGDGKLQIEISKTCSIAELVVDQLEFEVQVGALDPIDTDTGLAQRLTNLGYFVPPFEEGVVQDAGSDADANAETDAGSDGGDDEPETADGESDEDATDPEPEPEMSDELRSAIEEFQCDQKLTVNGKKDDAAMLDKLLELHGS